MTKNVLKLTFLFAVVEQVVAESEQRKMKVAFLPRRLGGACSKCLEETAPEPFRYHLDAQDLAGQTNSDEGEQSETRVRFRTKARRHPADPYRSWEYGRERTFAPVTPRLRGTAQALRPRGTDIRGNIRRNKRNSTAADQTFEERLEETKNAREEYYSLQQFADRFYDQRRYRERLQTARRRYVDLAHPGFSESTVTRRSGRKLRGRRH